MNHKLLLLCLMLTSAFTSSAQVLVGDMDDDGDITTVDVAQVVSTALGKTAKRNINPYQVNNSPIVGTWYRSKTESITFKEDGTTDYGTDYTYEYMPGIPAVLIYNATGTAVTALDIYKLTTDQMIMSPRGSSTLLTYVKTVPVQLVTSVTLSSSSLTLTAGDSQTLTATVGPSDADNKSVTWTTSNSSVATVVDGTVTGVGAGTATITATAADGSGVQATCTVKVPSLVSSITLDKTTLTLDMDDNNSYTLSATVLPANADDTSVSWESSDEDVAMVSSNGKVVSAGYGTATITCTAKDGSGVKATCKVTVRQADTKEAVDLGLSVKWATCNVGASSPEKYGNYFAWGETTGYDEGKTYFYWSTYTLCNGSDATITKYCTVRSYGTVDYKTVLESSDDAATANWGGSWRMPTYSEQTELRTGCYWEWTSSYNSTGVAGYIVYKVKSDSDKGVYTYSDGSSSATVTGSYSLSDTHIFLPAAGRRESSSLNSAGSGGYYWSSSLYSTYSNSAYDSILYSSNVYWSNSIRYSGRSVRPVCQ